MKRFYTQILLFCVCTSFSKAASLSLEDFRWVLQSFEDSEDVEATWTLEFKGKEIGQLESLGSRPKLLKIENCFRKKTQDTAWVLFLDAGAGGTRVITEEERFWVILEPRGSRKQWTKSLDELARITRYRGAENLLDQKRSLQWSEDCEKLSLGAMDEAPSKTFHWVGDDLVPES